MHQFYADYKKIKFPVRNIITTKSLLYKLNNANWKHSYVIAVKVCTLKKITEDIKTQRLNNKFASVTPQINHKSVVNSVHLQQQR